MSTYIFKKLLLLVRENKFSSFFLKACNAFLALPGSKGTEGQALYVNSFS